jgi:hypothetical protein
MKTECRNYRPRNPGIARARLAEPGFTLEGNARWWGLVGILPLATSLMRWCPAYAPFGIDTGASTSG